MATVGTFCFDGANFAQATSLYTDSALTNLAPDGYYAQGTISRRQLNGVLLAPAACSSCIPPCGTSVSTSTGTNGLFASQSGLGEVVGAVIFYIYPYNQIPDGVLITHNGNTYNRLTTTGNNGNILTDGIGTSVPYSGFGNQGTGLPTYVGNQNGGLLGNYNLVPSSPCSAFQQLEDYTLVSGSYVAQGTLNSISVVSSQLGLTSLTPQTRAYTMVVPKTVSSVFSLDIDIFAPMCSTSFKYNVYCPESLPSFQASSEQLNNSCASNAATYYFSRNAVYDLSSSSIIPETNTTPVVGNFVFTNNTGSNYLNDTSTNKWYIINNSTFIRVRYGVVIEVGNCT
jgi:hypothetical protein